MIPSGASAQTPHAVASLRLFIANCASFISLWAHFILHQSPKCDYRRISLQFQLKRRRRRKKKALRIRVIATEQGKKKNTSHIHNRTLGRRRLVIYFRRARLICIERCLSRVAALMKLGRGAPRPLGEVLFRCSSNTLMPNAFCQLTPRRVCVTSRSERGATS